jgi:hypothetical protein
MHARTYAHIHTHTLLAYSFRLVLVLMSSIAFPYMRLLTTVPSPSDRFWRVGQVDNSQANEDHSPERLLS